MAFKRFEIIIKNFFPCICIASYYCLFTSGVSHVSERGVDEKGVGIRERKLTSPPPS